MLLLSSSSFSPGPPDSFLWDSDLEPEEEVDEEARVHKEKLKRRRRRKAAATRPPVFGDNCHSCRREIAEGKVLFVTCSRCPLRFCGSCLLRKHGEDVVEEMEENVRWVCPICRGGCGPGCRMNCCGCGPCRKYQNLEPAGRILPAAFKAGFNDVHDYLVHFETNEPPEVIAKRKEGRGWTKATGAIDRSFRCCNLTWALKGMRSTRRRGRVPACWGPGGAISKRPTQNGLKEEPLLCVMIPAEERDRPRGKRVRRPSIRPERY